jgi:hypothetical protein
MMDVIERYVRLCGEVSNYTKRLTSIPLVDAYFGPAELSPSKQNMARDPESLIEELNETVDQLSDIQPKLRSKYLIGEVKSIILVVDWLRGNDIPYTKLVEGLFNIKITKYSDRDIERAKARVDEVSSYSKGSLKQRVAQIRSQGEVKGYKLREVIEKELQPKSTQVGHQFKEMIFSRMGVHVQDNGVKYRSVQNKPWSGYNYYQGDFQSVNEFNIDRSMNKYNLLSVVYHEYEHHVSNLWREKAYREQNYLDLSVVPLHTGRCVISEGTADMAKEFVGILEDDDETKAFQSLRDLSKMVSINAAIMMNHECYSVDDTVNYISENQFKTEEEASGIIGFICPTNQDGSANFWAPYIFTYFIGREHFVKPTFDRAISNSKEIEFFKTLYLNPYSGSSTTWNDAFNWLS